MQQQQQQACRSSSSVPSRKEKLLGTAHLDSPSDATRREALDWCWLGLWTAEQGFSNSIKV
jgi:hypothetical protein